MRVVSPAVPVADRGPQGSGTPAPDDDPVATIRRHGVTPDPLALRRFRSAATRLATATTTDEREGAATDAAAALAGLAADGRADELRSVLTPDPTNANGTWTVCCYQIGDLAPSGLHDFPDPLAAMASLLACPVSSHVAAELITSTHDGLRWTALARNNDRVVFQLPDPSTAQDSSGGRAVAGALRRWDEQLDRWLGGGDDEVMPMPPNRTGSVAPPAIAPSAPAVATPAPHVSVDLAGLVTALEGTRRQQTPQVPAFDLVERALVLLDDRVAADRREAERAAAEVGERLGQATELLAQLQADIERSEAAHQRLTTRIAATEMAAEVTARRLGALRADSEKAERTAIDLAEWLDQLEDKVVAVRQQGEEADATLGSRVDTVEAAGGRLADRLEELAAGVDTARHVARADTRRVESELSARLDDTHDRATVALAVARQQEQRLASAERAAALVDENLASHQRAAADDLRAELAARCDRVEEQLARLAATPTLRTRVAAVARELADTGWSR